MCILWEVELKLGGDLDGAMALASVSWFWPNGCLDADGMWVWVDEEGEEEDV